MTDREARERARKLRFFRLLGIVFVMMIFLLAFLRLVWPRKAYSAQERRTLAQLPAMTTENLRNGAFSDAMEEYLADQFPARNVWVYLDELRGRIMGEKYSQGVYRSGSNYLIEEFKRTDDNRAAKTTKAVLDYLREYPDIPSYIMLVPNSSWIMNDKLPSGAPIDSQEEWYTMWSQEVKNAGLSNLTVVPTAAALSAEVEQGKQVYYRTDHHWTTYGAYVGARELAQAMKLPFEEQNWKQVVVHDRFQGTLMSKSGFYSRTADTVELYLPDPDIEIVTTYKEQQKTLPGLYSSEGLTGDDPYEVFFGGNYPWLAISTKSKSNRKLLIFKDSYANAMIGFLCPFFSEIHVVDPRYYTGDIRTLTASAGITDICFLYNINTYYEDGSLSLILEGGEADE